jgi:predicted N-acetyltransferase YhbS
MVVVGALELVFHDEGSIVGEVLSEKVERVAADRVLRLGQLDVDAERLAEEAAVGEEPD